MSSQTMVEELTFEDDGVWPNNPRLPLLLYRQAVELGQQDPAGKLVKLFTGNDWAGAWRNGIFSFHHYHSNAHEVLGIASGSARVQFGGPNGNAVDVTAGDVPILPAGTAHKLLEASGDFRVVGAYPEGQGDYDMMRGEEDEGERARDRIAAVPLPKTDPVFGKHGPLLDKWQAEEGQ